MEKDNSIEKLHVLGLLLGVFLAIFHEGLFFYIPWQVQHCEAIDVQRYRRWQQDDAKSDVLV
jgi:hypothetical protein